jgi:uncharacterized protein YbaR (Trm112 family)
MTELRRDPPPKADDRNEHRVDPRLLEMLACPLTKGTLSWDPVRRELISRGARLAYPVRDGVPIMLPSEARTLDSDELG